MSSAHALPDARRTPSSESTVNRIPVAVLRYITSRRARAQPPQDAIDDVAIILGRTAPAALARLPLNRQQNLQNTPLDLRQIAAAQDCLLKSAALNQNEIHASMILSTLARSIALRCVYRCS